MIVRPITKKQAVNYCKRHPHAPSVPNSSKYYMAAFNKAGFLGLAVWGWGIVPAQTPKKLFGEGLTSDYLELSRFFVIDKAKKNTPSQFLNLTARLIKKYDKKVKYLYTYAAGFQGLIGTIYQASGYKYIGTIECKFPYIKGVGLVHPISLYHRYKKTSPKHLTKIFGDKYTVLHGMNFCYIKFICDKKTEKDLLSKAKFKVKPYPTKKDLKIWDRDGKSINPEIAKHIPIVKLKTKIMR
tara:strand:+ start:112 stop:831 length:720 start_codon:yes stop_codon:yes gene_type:complete